MCDDAALRVRSACIDVTVCEVYDRGVVETAANGRLIAAAPDLLEACKDALDWYETAPIVEIEAVEKIIQRTFPYKSLMEALARAPRDDA